MDTYNNTNYKGESMFHELGFSLICFCLCLLVQFGDGKVEASKELVHEELGHAEENLGDVGRKG
jgi:hypothetical protein